MTQNEYIKASQLKSDMIDQIISINKLMCRQQNVDYFMLDLEPKWKADLQAKSKAEIKGELRLKTSVLIGKNFMGYFSKDDVWVTRTIARIEDFLVFDKEYGTGWFIDSIELF